METRPCRVGIVYHRIDLDGICTKTIVERYLQTREIESNIIFIYGYDYPDSTKALEAMLSDYDRIDELYVLDVTLPKELMATWADKIIAIDHHDTGVERCAPFMSRFKLACVQLNHPLVYNVTGEEVAEKAAACELAWVTFFQDQQIPLIVRLCGRYDVWDHDSEEMTLSFNEACRDREVIYNPRLFTEMFEKYGHPHLSEVDHVDLLDIVEEGRLIREIGDKLNARDCRAGSRIFKFGNTDLKVLVANQAGRNSKFFKVKADEDFDVMIMFACNLTNMNWKVSIFTSDKKKIDMSRILDPILREPNYVLSHGGHMQTACGFTTTNIQHDLLRYLRKE